jgi:hypothetical protein
MCGTAVSPYQDETRFLFWNRSPTHYQIFDHQLLLGVAEDNAAGRKNTRLTANVAHPVEHDSIRLSRGRSFAFGIACESIVSVPSQLAHALLG